MSSDNPSGADNQQETSEVGSSTSKLDPNWVVGFVDGEGCFSVSIHRNPRFARRTFGWQVRPVFHVYQHSDHLGLLMEFVTFFGCGKVRKKGPSSSVSTYAVDALREIDSRIVPFFSEHLPRVKLRDFLIFSDVVRSMRRGEHATPLGLIRIVRMAYEMNAHGKQRARGVDEVINGILRDCMPGPTEIVGEDTVRPPWRHGELGRNALALYGDTSSRRE
jgi:hypothetical protein